MDKLLKEHVWDRACSRSEYCLLPQWLTDSCHQIDHIIAQKHQGMTDSNNLALACILCNSYKGPNIAGVDHISGKIARLFNPRFDDWQDHFDWDDAVLMGLTDIGRATVTVLKINLEHRIRHRSTLIIEGVFPS